ncbi:MAG: hypothetical protein KAI84_08075, partial [Gammaproteobacteria bacterium]|nr:hypothetical protein [Gammaproteobacteria bacterium]
SGKIYSIIYGCYSFSNPARHRSNSGETGGIECPIFKQTIDMIYHENDLTTQLFNHLTWSVVSIRALKGGRMMPSPVLSQIEKAIVNRQ